METATLVPLEEYLHTSYEPDCDYVDGVIEQRNVGEYDHANMLGIVYRVFSDRRKELNIQMLPAQRMRAVYTPQRKRYRVPDICVLLRPYLKEPVLTHPPLIAIEVLSPEDRMSRLLEKIKDFVEMGIPHIWVTDPYKRRLLVWDGSALREISDLRVQVPELKNLIVDFHALFAELDEE